MTNSRSIRLEKALLLTWFVLNLVLGAFTVHEYGMSVDEPNNQRYAADTLDAYPSLLGILYEPRYDSSYDGHGPAFATLALLFVRIGQGVFPRLFEPDLWHFAYFLTFPLTGLCLYWLARRWFHVWTAWGVLILFSTQPLLHGHAFINPKDTPFMFFLTLSVVCGFRMVDAVAAGESYVSLERPVATLKDRFQKAAPHRQKMFLTLLAAGIGTAVLLVVFSTPIDALLEQIVTYFYNAESGSWASGLFSALASHNTPIGDYVSKAIRLLDRAERGLFAAGIVFLVVNFGLVINDATLNTSLRQLWLQRHKSREWGTALATSVRNSTGLDQLSAWLSDFFQAVRNPNLLTAGITLGLATGIRAIGPLAGAVVLVYLFARSRSRAWAPGAAYFLVTGVVTYLAWPRLWGAPIRRYLEALGIASSFPHFPGRVLFDGQLYGSGDLPRSYLPTLLGIQLTEPLILCVVIGFCFLIWRLLRRRVPTDLLLYIVLGFVLPLAALIVLRSPLYHNFRQVLFLVPAMVMTAAFTLEFIFNKQTKYWVRLLLLAVLAVPGLYSTVRLYPYEYVYYNSLVSGPAGAAHRYELDYWRVSLREIALELNEVASPESIIVVTRSAGLLARYTRPDLVVDKPINSILDLDHGYDYIVHVTRGKGGDLYPEVESLIVVERVGAVLATAKYVRGVSGR